MYELVIQMIVDMGLIIISMSAIIIVVIMIIALLLLIEWHINLQNCKRDTKHK